VRMRADRAQKIGSENKVNKGNQGAAGIWSPRTPQRLGSETIYKVKREKGTDGPGDRRAGFETRGGEGTNRRRPPAHST